MKNTTLGHPDHCVRLDGRLAITIIEGTHCEHLTFPCRMTEARVVIADVANHSDQLIRLACNVLAQHGETPAECTDAQRLLVVIDARRPVSRAQREDQGRASQ